MTVKNRYAALLLMVSFLMLDAVYANTNYSYDSNFETPYNNYVQKPLQYSGRPLRGSVVTVPAGTSFHANLTSELSSETASAGQSVAMFLSKDFYYNNKLIAPSGSSVTGTVVEATGAKHGSLNGRLSVRFTQITTPTGMQIPISALIKTDDSTGVLVGGTKMDVTKEYAKDIAVGSAAGALSGVVFGALSGGDIGRGAALGTAIGAGGGIAKSVIDVGNNVVLPANAGIELILTQPITASASNYSYEN